MNVCKPWPGPVCRGPVCRIGWLFWVALGPGVSEDPGFASTARQQPQWLVVMTNALVCGHDHRPDQGVRLLAFSLCCVPASCRMLQVQRQLMPVPLPAVALWIFQWCYRDKASLG